MARVRASRVPLKQVNKRELYATVCFYYPRYSLKEAQQLKARDIALLIKTAEKIEATRLYHLTQIAAAPHSKGGRGVKKLIDYFKKKVTDQ